MQSYLIEGCGKVAGICAAVNAIVSEQPQLLVIQRDLYAMVRITSYVLRCQLLLTIAGDFVYEHGFKIMELAQPYA